MRSARHFRPKFGSKFRGQASERPNSAEFHSLALISTSRSRRETCRTAIIANCTGSAKTHRRARACLPSLARWRTHWARVNLQAVQVNGAPCIFQEIHSRRTNRPRQSQVAAFAATPAHKEAPLPPPPPDWSRRPSTSGGQVTTIRLGPDARPGRRWARASLAHDIGGRQFARRFRRSSAVVVGCCCWRCVAGAVQLTARVQQDTAAQADEPINLSRAPLFARSLALGRRPKRSSTPLALCACEPRGLPGAKSGGRDKDALGRYKIIALISRRRRFSARRNLSPSCSGETQTRLEVGAGRETQDEQARTYARARTNTCMRAL